MRHIIGLLCDVFIYTQGCSVRYKCFYSRGMLFQTSCVVNFLSDNSKMFYVLCFVWKKNAQKYNIRFDQCTDTE